MIRLAFRIVAALLVAALAGPVVAADRKAVVAYVPNWIDLKSFAKTIDYAKVTHLNIAFENPHTDDGELPFNPNNQHLLDAAKPHKVKVLISIGGGAAAGDATLLKRYALLLSDDKRADFVAKLTKYVEAHDFDGLDVDLEGPAIGEKYGAFIADLARALKPKGKLLTAALSKGYGGNNVPDAALKQFDLVHVMAYDSKGPWNRTDPGQHSSIDFAKDNIAYWIGRGVPKDRLTLGVPFYGYGFGKAYRNRDYPYKDIVGQHPGAEDADQTGDTIWHNGRPTIRAKAKYAIDQGLAGVMIWSLDSDAAGEKSLLTALDEAMRGK